GAEAESILAMIKNIHDLSDLSARPVLLDMILMTLPELKQKNEPINSAALYDHYTNKWTTRDEWRVSLPLEVRQGFCETLAWIMHSSNVPETDYEVLERAIANCFLELSGEPKAMDRAKNDIQTCSFLVRSGSNDRFRFAHKSFVEFFVAKKIVNDLI